MDLNKTDEAKENVGNLVKLINKSNGYIFGGIEGRTLLQEEEYVPTSADAFSSAGVWSHLTYLWLNPLFGKVRTQKLRLPHVPLILQSEAAFVASSLVEESLRKQNTETLSLPIAIVHALWRPLALNGLLAARQCKPPPWTDSCIHLRLCKDSGISLSQRQWYFGVQGIGIRVWAALMVLIYKKSLSVKYGGMSNGKVVNFITVDVEMLRGSGTSFGDFSLLLFLGTLFSLLKMVGDFSLLVRFIFVL
ncbi:P-loop containing nucleoside triphosphate hydrolases superfamily protein [Actinidia rufa]|uniref:P-loop containing nucleoside triphosphate hydrolases superfamily protein n=1 Tax=Actinidia rufa TaxID=165716 RepID=A0A7J0GT90_9ERIC|nr:P-loop containing nucleoside triphosphate hydrolases superfamily protein [Actinidia rufa]